MALIKRNTKGSPLTHNEMDTNWTQIENWLAQKAAANHTHSIANISGLQSELEGKIPITQKAVANGVASLGVDGKVPLSQLPQLTATGQLFPHDTLTVGDIGKFVIWKDGKCQLPVFEPPVEGVPGVMKYTLNLTSLHSFNPDTLLVDFTSNPSDGDTITIAGDTYTFKTTASASKEVEIGASIADTIDNLESEYDLYRPAYINRNKNSTQIEFISIDLGLSGTAWTFSGDYFLDSGASSSYCTLTNGFVSVENRLQDILVPFLILWGFGAFQGQTKSDALISFYSTTPVFTADAYIDGVAVNIPADLDELKGSIALFLEDIEDVVDSVSWYSTFFEINLKDEFPEHITIDSGDEDFWNNAFELDAEIVSDIVFPTITYCKYKIVGQVSNIIGSQVEIRRDGILQMTLTGDEDVEDGEWLILNPSLPGHVMSTKNLDTENPNDMFNQFRAGYLASLDLIVNPDTSFYGVLQDWSVSEIFLSSIFGGGFGE